MNKFTTSFYRFIAIILFSSICLCFGRINLAIAKNKTDTHSNYTTEKSSIKQQNSILHTKNKNTNNTHRLLATSDSNDLSIWSNAFNFTKSGNSEVDPRTGTLLASVKVGLLLSNFGHGPDIDLEMNYNSAAKGNPDHLGRGWAWNLTHYNPVTHQLNTSGGKSFFLKQNGNGHWFPQYHKLKDVIITGSKEGHFVITSANGLRDILDHDGYEVRLEQQNGEGVNFNYLPGSHILQTITDDDGHIIQLEMKNNYLTVTSDDVQGQPVTMHISLENDEVRNIWFPGEENKQTSDHSKLIHFSYNTMHSNLLSDIHYFTGMEKQFAYDCENAMKLPANQYSLQPFTPLCVIKQTTTIPGANQPPVTTNYTYTSANRNNHNYLGYNAGLTQIPDSKTDILFQAPADYTYQTVEDNTQTRTIRTYNKYHLLIDTKVISNKSGKQLSETQAYFCRTDKLDGCANTTFDQLPVTYSLPLQIVTKTWGESPSLPEMTTINRHYDDNGRVISQTDSYGRRTETTYCPQSGDSHCPVAPEGWPAASLAEKTALFPASEKGEIPLLPVTTTMDYQKEKNVNQQGYSLVLYRKTVQSGTMQRTEIRQYYHDNKNPLTYGLLKQKQLTGTNLPSKSVQVITHHYQYILNKDGTETISGSTDVANNQSVLSSVIKKSLYFPKTLLITSADKQNVHTFMYDKMGRLTAQTEAAGTPFEVTTRYQYQLSADNNSVIVTNPGGMQKKTTFDGIGRVIATYIEKTDLQGHLQPGLWQQQTQTSYNTEGKVASNILYMDNGQGNGTPVALTTRFNYDALGRVIKKYLPDGEAVITKYDDAHRCIIHYSQDAQNHRTAVTVDLSNVTGKPTAHIVLPAIKGELPSVTILCTQGNQQPDAKVSTMVYDGFDRLISTKDPMGKRVQYRYDAFGQVTDTINPAGDKLQDVYDLTGHVIQHLAMPAKGGQYLLSSAGFNAAGQKLWSAGEDNMKTTYHYNINGQLPDTYKPSNHHLILYYNVVGLPVKESLDGHLLLQVSYDHLTRQPVTVTDNTGITTYHYRDDGFLQSATHKGISGYPDTFSSITYDSYHRLISRTDTNNNKTIYAFDKLGRPIEEAYQKNKSNSVTIYHSVYDGFSRIVKKVYGSGMIRTLSYDPWGQVRTIKDVLNGKTLSTSAFVYDADGNITRLQHSDDQDNQATTQYSYDRLDNLVTMACQGDSVLCPHDTTFAFDHLKAAPVINEQHYYFNSLNRITKVIEKLIDTSSSGWHSLSKTMTYNYSNTQAPLRLTSVSTQWDNQPADTHSFTYDTTGNMTTDGEGNKISYNPFNQITKVINPTGMSSHYEYNGQGKEIKETNAQGTRWMIYQGNSLSGEMVTDKNNTLHVIGYPAPEIKTTDNTITDWYESSYKGDVMSLLSQDKTSRQWKIKQHRTYSPYGMMWSYNKGNTTTQDIQKTLKGFDGEITDPVTGWQFLGAGNRTYNPAQRYFVSEDPAGDGYGFGSNNPIMNSDPSGNIPKWLGKSFKLGSYFSSAGLGAVHNKFSKAFGALVGWAAIAVASYGVGNILGLVFAPPAGLAFTSAVNPANKGLQKASQITGGIYTGALFVAGLIAVVAGVGLAETAAAGSMALAETASETSESTLSDLAIIDLEDSAMANASEEGEADNTMNVTNELEESTAQSSTNDGATNSEEELSGETKRAVFGCGNAYAGGCHGRCAHPYPEIDTFDIEPEKAPDFNVDLDNTEEVVTQAGENIYDEILQEYTPGPFFETAHRLLKPGGNFYVLLSSIRLGSQKLNDTVVDGIPFFKSVKFIESEGAQARIISNFGTVTKPDKGVVILEFHK